MLSSSSIKANSSMTFCTSTPTHKHPFRCVSAAPDVFPQAQTNGIASWRKEKKRKKRLLAGPFCQIYVLFIHGWGVDG
ncbi:hypothetical protein BDU57DRAFT_510536 [Ampelomyces quisqualis]|uniref:Uncharacterized protein n=1 Tax=Ampelomyces quisqualis TaxID=50730 RepID=A0A6A5R0R5_AMPQU|nr:hypothetical protein BDU57DRAFT_510536 [Ampelomyces quisqualis]